MPLPESPQAVVGRTLRLLVALVLITVMVIVFAHGIKLV